MAKHAITRVILSFSTTYLSGTAFSALVAIKIKALNRLDVHQGPHVQKWRTHFFTSTIRCIKSEMTVEMCGASRQQLSYALFYSC